MLFRSFNNFVQSNNCLLHTIIAGARVCSALFSADFSNLFLIKVDSGVFCVRYMFLLHFRQKDLQRRALPAIQAALGAFLHWGVANNVVGQA